MFIFQQKSPFKFRKVIATTSKKMLNKHGLISEPCFTPLFDLIEEFLDLATYLKYNCSIMFYKGREQRLILRVEDFICDHLEEVTGNIYGSAMRQVENIFKCDLVKIECPKGHTKTTCDKSI